MGDEQIDRLRERMQMPRHLANYWLTGLGAARIRWGTPGDMTRCIRLMREYVGANAGGTCQNLHKRRFGRPNPRD